MLRQTAFVSYLNHPAVHHRSSERNFFFQLGPPTAPLRRCKSTKPMRALNHLHLLQRSRNSSCSPEPEATKTKRNKTKQNKNQQKLVKCSIRCRLDRSLIHSSIHSSVLSFIHSFIRPFSDRSIHHGIERNSDGKSRR